MSRRREPWYLFCGDQTFAEQCLLHDFQRCREPAEQASLLQLLSRLGGWALLEKLIEAHPALLAEPDGRAALFHLRQAQRQPNPWLSLLPAHEQSPFLQSWKAWPHAGQPLQVMLSGGLGDQLEALAILAAHPARESLTLVLPETGKAALKPLLELLLSTMAAPGWRFGVADPQQSWLNWMAFQALMAGRSERLVPASLFGQLRATCQRQIVVCWRSKVDRRERLWAHLRSLPFAAITHLYGWLLPWAQEHDYQIADITRYTSTETEILRRQRSSQHLQLLAPELRSLADTARLAGSARQVISVDTALIHIAHGVDVPRWLLLHCHPDARWLVRLLQDGGSDQRSLRVLQQTRPSDWREPLEQVRIALNA